MRTRTKIIAAGAAAAVLVTVLAAAVLTSGGKVITKISAPEARASAPAIPDVDLSSVHWTGFHGYRVPASAQAGPRDTANGLASGYSDTPLGALMAIVNIGVRTAWQFGPGIFQPTIQDQVTGPDRAAMLASDQQMYAADAAQIADVTVYATIPAFQWEGYTASQATVELVSSASANGHAIYAATQVEAQWLDGDWRVVAPPGGDWGNSAAQITSLAGFTFFPGQGG